MIMLVLACSLSGCTSPQSPQTAATLTPVQPVGSNDILIKNFAFSPASLTIRTGTTVTWLNQDGAQHQIASDPVTPSAFNSDPLADGTSYQFTFTKPGTYTYHCTIHPSMKGTVIVEA
jgi:plastocyanin